MKREAPRQGVTVNLLICWLLMATAVGCASGSTLTRHDVLLQYEEVSRLNNELVRARNAQIDVLAPARFTATSRLLDEAVASARKADKKRADRLARQGFEELERAWTTAEANRDELAQVLTEREQAIAARAPALFPKDFKQAEEQLKRVARKGEEGQLDALRQERPGLVKTYSELRLRALKKGLVEAARAAIDDAEKKGARKHAATTLQVAREELKLAVAVLESDPSKLETANEHASRSVALAGRAAAISELVRSFQSRDFTPEDIVLWFQDRLQVLEQPLGTDLHFENGYEQVVTAVHDRIVQLQADKNRSVRELAAAREEAARKLDSMRQTHSAQLAACEKDIAAQDAARAAREKAAAEARQRLETVQNLFAREEATVYRERDDLLIRLHGFSFKVGDSEVEATNFDLLDRLIKALKQFPDAHIVVSGHTDSKGAADRNEALSTQRATKVAEFLVTVGGIDRKRIQAVGFGEENPVASNDTPEGRAKNRRIEIRIMGR